MRQRIIAVCGPTASGKSALGIALASRLGGEIVNLDSVQVYKELDIGSAKLSLEDRKIVPHHLFDLLDPTHRSDIAEFRALAGAAISDIAARGRVPILVGGSGLYFTTLIHGLADLPSGDQEVRRDLEALSSEDLHSMLQGLDLETAKKLAVADRRRVIRAIEVARKSGIASSELVQQHGYSQIAYDTLCIVPCVARNELYSRINARSQAMVEDGLLSEVAAIVERYGCVGVLDTLGYREALQVLDGSLPREQLAEQIAQGTRRFAKRQMTYWRNEPNKRGWRTRPAADEDAIEITGFEASTPAAERRMKGFRAFDWDEAGLISKAKAWMDSGDEGVEVWFVKRG